ncbi:hypothetical protein GpartN1_g847.t1 [Galdieria partita]|uniref:Uncharacterized protein n=1 Tax=Galdieria partita TaxID=83374 RepID=A0A9C7UN41_9RHOD|nr:hypothetical protein GpartN1_g847.t1 [Galdieria partita]
MFVDISSSYNTALYVIAIECFLFFAVITQTKTEEAESLDLEARGFAAFFLFQSLALLFWAFSNELFPGPFSYYSAHLSAAFGICCIFSLSFTAASIAVFDRRKRALHRFIVILNYGITAVCSILAIDFPGVTYDLAYLPEPIKQCIIGAAIGSLLANTICCLIRCFEANKGRNGALISLLGSLFFIGTCIGWLYLNNVCVEETLSSFSPSCPLGKKFDHNFFWAIVLVVINVLGAEGALRIMAANHEYEDYVDIP